ncbi:MAG: endo-1,4-beta-xylanase [Verrucomicrobiota bacterium]
MPHPAHGPRPAWVLPPFFPVLATAALTVATSGGCLRPAGTEPVTAARGPSAPATGLRPLREAAASSRRHVGTAFMTPHLAERAFAEVAAAQFDSLTPENEMKWEAVEPQPGKFTFAKGDALVAFAAAHAMRVRGHTLVWHSQLPAWAKALSGDPLRAAMLAHVRGVVAHWKGTGKIAQWDVVNEALSDGPGGGLRGDSPFTALGPTFLDDAFRAAHEVDPAALLFYNDYEIEWGGTAKAESAFELVQQLRARGVPIHGVGLQMHVDPRHWGTADQIRANIERYAALGLLVEITEMDVPVGEIPGSIDQKLERQRAITHDIVAACWAVDRCSGITFWGLTDKHSWLNSPRWGALRGRLPHHPLPFDAAYRAKPMLSGILDAFEGR